MKKFTGLKKKETVGSERRLLQHCKLPEKNFRVISRDIWEFFAVFQNFVYLFHDFFAEYLKMFRGTLVVKHRFRASLCMRPECDFAPPA
jgi:hypothetical protein